ncbi:hypothetical protein ACHAP3_000668 [Botrytis cinerea]
MSQTYIEVIGKSILSDDLTQKLTDADTNQPGDPRGAIDAFLGKWTVPFNVIVYLSFIKTLLIYTNDDEEICGAFLTILPDATPEDLAKELFPQDKLDTLLASDSNTLPDNLTANDVNQVRARFLADQPLVIILVMIRDDGDFTLEDRPRTIIVLILELMVKRQAKLGSAELVSMLKENFPQDDSPLNDKEITSASTFVRCVKSLSYLVEDPLDIPRLYDSKYHSIRSITSKSKNDFKSDLHSAGASTANALKIHDCAERVDCWNEQLWLALMKAGKADVADSMIPQPEDDDTDSTNDTVKPTRPLASLSGPPESWNNLTDIFRLENVACEECCSITSMSAYFADLLNLLSNTTPTGGTKATTNDASASSDSGTNSTLLDLLSARRPDLTKLELSCANSQTLIPNINLVNEVLESFIRYKSQSLLSESASDDQDCILVFNTPADASDDCVQDGHSDGPVYRPGNTDFEVYSKVVSQQMYPFTCFLYDYAWSSVKEYFNIFQIPYTQLIEVFQAPELLFEKITQVARDKLSEEQRIGLLRGSAEVLKRQNAASVLNLHQKEFAAIAGETFFPAWFAAWLEGLASDIVPIATGPPEGDTATQWGYEDEDTMLESTNELGLTYIKQQLMKRSGLDFPDILDLVKTQLFGKDLVIINKTGSKEFSTFIDDLRLLDVFETAQLEDVQDGSGLQLTRAILEGTVDLKKSLSSISTVDIPTSETVVDCVGRTFDATTASTILGFIEGTQILTGYATLSNKAALDSLVSLAKDWPNKVSVIPSIEGKIYSAQIKLCGILTSSEKTKILDGSKDFPAINAALVTLVATSLFPQNIIKSRFENNPDSSGKLQNNVLLDDWEEPPSESSDSSSPNASSIAAENYLRNRRAAFIDLAKPTIIQDLLTSLILNSTKDQIIDVDVSIIASLVSDVVKVPTKDNSGLESAMTALQSLSVPIESSIQVNLDAYFTPTTTDDYTIHYTGTSTNPEITINGLKMPYDSSANTWSQFRMISGQAYLLQADFDSSQVSWSTCRSMPTLFTDEELLLSATVQRTTSVLEAIRKVALICQTLKLTTTEIAFFNRQVQLKFEMLAIDLNSPSLKDLVQLQGYCALRDTCIPSTKDDNLMSLFSWLSSSTDADASSIVTKIAASTGWNNTLVESALDQKYPNYTAGNLMTTLRNYDNFSGLNAIVQFYDSLGGVSDINSMPPIAELFNLARPAQQLDNADSYVQAAQDLQNRLTAAQQENFDDGLMQTQRAALVNYLLQQDYIKDLNIWDADGLFEYFLVDVQIGPQLRTSRVKQAISVVQLYTQRCLLGLEEDVAMTDVRRDKWDWMQQYTLWEANRKLFLYPENWIDPMLRDDKSQLFDQFEAALLQKDLSIDTFLHAIQNYVYGLNEISKLDIVAYVHEPEFKEADIFHFFGRTRTAPYSFYYRTPWTKIDMDIPSIETEWEGHRLDNVGSYLLPEIIGGRLYLFMPSIMPKSLATNIGDNLKGVATFDDLRGQSPNIAAPERVWEISMGWTELIRGSWAPKRVSAGTLTVGLAASASQFRVEPTFDDNKMTMKINYSTIGNTDFNEIGSFIFFNDQISTISSDSTTSVSGNFPTYFQKVLGKGIKQVALSIDPPDPDKPLIWVPHDLTSYNQNDLTWTLSKTQQRVTALVVTTIDSDGMSLSRFNMPRTELTPTDGHQWTSQRVIDDMELVQLDHSFSHELMEHTTDRVDPLGNLYNNLAETPADQLKERYGAGSQNASYHELGHPTAIYNWEIGIHAVYLAVDRLSTTQQYDETLQIARLVFDPSVSVQVDRSDGEKTISTKTCWKFPPFQDMACMMANKGESSFDPLDLANLKKEIELAIKERRSYGALVHAAARGRPVSYMKWIVMKYAEILIALGNIQFRRGTSECLPLATQRYIEAARVKDNAFDEVSLDLGLPFSFNIVPKGNAAVSSTDPRMENITCVLKKDYFSIPLNPKFKTMRSLVQERLFNIRNSFDIQGKPVVYALRDPPIDPGDLVALGKQGLSISDVLSMISGERDGPLTNQRFATLMGAALNLCTEVRSLGESLLAAIEKKDAESLNIILARNNTGIQQGMLEMKQIELDGAQKTIESLLIDRSSQEAQLDYYLKLIGEPDTKIPKPGDDWTDVPQNIDVQSSDELRMSPYEKLQMTMSLSSYSKNSQATVTDAVALPLYLLPTIQGDFEPLGVGTSISAGGTQYAEFVAAGSALLRGFAALDASQADQADKKASLTAQLQDRRFQANISGRQIKSIDKQIEIQQIQIKSIQKDLDMQKSQLDEAVQAETWYRSKYTNEQLYSWMEKRLRNLYLQAYNLVLDAALQAQSAFSFEAGRKCSIIKPAGYWDASRNGLLAAQDLFWDLKKLEATQAGNNSADYNITKTVSLKEINPMALMNFRIAGTCDFSLDELLFDMDFPGHYMRRIRSVAVSIPATFETNCSANAILTLLSHKYRVTQSAADYVASQAASGESFRTDRIPTSSIAVSNGDADSGVFELDFSGSQYMPFEGAGAISKWRLELPSPTRTFSYESITDVLLHVQYTAYEGGPSLRAAANQATLQVMKATGAEGQQQGFSAIFDLKHEFADDWKSFGDQLASQTADSNDTPSMKLGDLKKKLPYWSQRQDALKVQNITFITHSQELRDRLDIQSSTGDRTWNGSKIGDYYVKSSTTCSDTSLNWIIQGGTSPTKWDKKNFENAFLLIQYVFTGTEIV